MLFEYETNRLRLKILDSFHAAKILDFYNENKDFFNPYEPDRPEGFYTIKYQKSLSDFEYNGFLQGKFTRFYIFKKDNPNKIIGSVSFSNIQRGAFLSANIGYKIHTDYTNKGYDYEAIKKALDIMFSDGVLHRIEAYILPSNTPSLALIDKLGFRYEGVATSYVKLHGEWADHLRYSIINSMHQ